MIACGEAAASAASARKCRASLLHRGAGVTWRLFERESSSSSAVPPPRKRQPRLRLRTAEGRGEVELLTRWGGQTLRRGPATYGYVWLGCILATLACGEAAASAASARKCGASLLHRGAGVTWRLFERESSSSSAGLLRGSDNLAFGFVLKKDVGRSSCLLGGGAKR